MINVYHGEDNLSARKAFIDNRNDKSLTFDAENLSLVELSQSLQGSGLFTSENNFLVENLFSRKAKNVEETIEMLNEHAKDVEIYLYADKPIPAKTLGQLKNVVDNNFKIPQNIWSFLDGIRPNSHRNVNLFHGALSGNDPEIIFAMLLRQFRLLLSVSNSGNKIDEAKRLAPWQSSKLERQLSVFGQDKIKKIFKHLYKIDKDTKTGKTNLSLTQSIDILMLEL